MRSPQFTAVGKGWKVILTLSSITIPADGRAYMTTQGAGAYLVDTQGVCEGVEGTAGYTLQLVPNAVRRFRRAMKLRTRDTC